MGGFLLQMKILLIQPQMKYHQQTDAKNLDLAVVKPAIDKTLEHQTSSLQMEMCSSTVWGWNISI